MTAERPRLADAFQELNQQNPEVMQAVTAAFDSLNGDGRYSQNQEEIITAASSALNAVAAANKGRWNSTGIIQDKIIGRMDITVHEERVARLKLKGDTSMPQDIKAARAVFSVVSCAFDMLQFGTFDPEELNKRILQSRQPMPRYGFKDAGGGGRKTRQPNKGSDNNSH